MIITINTIGAFSDILATSYKLPCIMAFLVLNVLPFGWMSSYDFIAMWLSLITCCIAASYFGAHRSWIGTRVPLIFPLMVMAFFSANIYFVANTDSAGSMNIKLSLAAFGRAILPFVCNFSKPRKVLLINLLGAQHVHCWGSHSLALDPLTNIAVSDGMEHNKTRALHTTCLIDGYTEMGILPPRTTLCTTCTVKPEALKAETEVLMLYELENTAQRHLFVAFSVALAVSAISNYGDEGVVFGKTVTFVQKLDMAWMLSYTLHRYATIYYTWWIFYSFKTQEERVDRFKASGFLQQFEFYHLMASDHWFMFQVLMVLFYMYPRSVGGGSPNPPPTNPPTRKRQVKPRHDVPYERPTTRGRGRG